MKIKFIVPKFPGKGGYAEMQHEIKCRLVQLQVIGINALGTGKGGSERKALSSALEADDSIIFKEIEALP